MFHGTGFQRKGGRLSGPFLPCQAVKGLVHDDWVGEGSCLVLQLRGALGVSAGRTGQASSRLWAVALSSLWRRGRKKAVQ